MALKGNKGEWSEIYTLLKLLGEGKVYAGDQNLNKIRDLFYPIIMIMRHENDGDYNYKTVDRNIRIETADGEVLLVLPASLFLEESETLLEVIRACDGAFSAPRAEEFMNRIYCRTLKAKSKDKTDIRIVLHDRRTGLDSDMGFSIKSQLGGNSTLLNASGATNLNFKIVGADLSDEDIEQINSINSPKDKVIKRVQAIKEKGGSLVFDKTDNPIFARNLNMLDCAMQRFVAALLLEQLESGVSTLPELVHLCAEKDVLHVGCTNDVETYEYKAKHLLTSTALGMMPATYWNGRFDANGGYLVVKKDGEILCYHFYDRNRFEDFLFCNAYLERSSTTRHHYASIVKEEDGSLSFKLNIQIRLK